MTIQRCCYFATVLFSLFHSSQSLRATVFGASGGVGQLICRTLIDTVGLESVRAISRNVDSLAAFELLNGCDFIQADALQIDTLRPALSGSDYIIISVGTTAFPTKKWDNGNNPQTACVKTVETILQSIAESGEVPKKIVLLSSIGVEKVDEMPFKLLNSFGVLDAKRESEELLFRMSDELGYDAVVVRPGRLVGAPFTNFDLAKLLNLDQGSNKGIVIDKRDVLAGDCERADVATAIAKILVSNLIEKKNVFSVINKPGEAPSDMDW
eukprot:CAMPEP_0119049348 /NCGR_PEP_ID=MMETSP1177-20130426/64180_1 /TAXON_ID=2985 /ORGANISM="Ochromonas sp, Strain CCMP1899" /LENGTH=267 /DNA_ID=CAMNT_0007026445 /DNA_START=103 /DNA_END=903 /DNA_ORIENTATION=+